MWLSEELLDYNHEQAPKEAGEALCETIGEEIQRLSVVLSLPTLLETEEVQCMQRIVPKVQLALPNSSTEFHMAASATFLTILEKRLVNPKTFTQTFLQSILTSIDSRDSVVAGAWLETLLDVIDLLPPEVIKLDILPIALQKGQLSQTVHSRMTSCRLLGKMANKFDQATLKKDCLPLILSLCQDVKGEVRACICSQLSYVAKRLGPEALRPNLLPVLVELASDEEARVRLSAVESIVLLLPHLPPDTVKVTIAPLVKKLCESSLRSDDDVMTMISRNYGGLCIGLDSHITPPEKKWFLTFYQQMAQLGVRGHSRAGYMPDTLQDLVDRHCICRHNCAFNFPAMAVFATGGVAGSFDTFTEFLYPTFSDLAADPYFVVRKTVAGGIHEVARVLGSGNACVKIELAKLLRDDEEDVLTGLVPNLSRTLLHLVKANSLNPDVMDTAAIEIGRSLVKCEGVVAASNDWRLHTQLLQQMECLPQVLPAELLHSRFSCLIFSRAHEARQQPVRMAACRTMLVLLRYNLKLSQKNDTRSRIIVELCLGKSCYSRMTFLKLCGFALDIFSHRYFKEHFFSQLLEHADDRVATNRLVMVNLLPRLKAALKLPSDRKLLSALELVVKKLLTSEHDRDVVAALRRAVAAMDKIELPLDTDKHLSKEAQEDARKQEEESKLHTLSTIRGDAKAAVPVSVIGGVKPKPEEMQNRFNPQAIVPSASRGVVSPSVSPTPQPSSQRSSRQTLLGKTQPPSPEPSTLSLNSGDREFLVDAGVAFASLGDLGVRRATSLPTAHTPLPTERLPVRRIRIPVATSENQAIRASVRIVDNSPSKVTTTMLDGSGRGRSYLGTPTNIASANENSGKGRSYPSSFEKGRNCMDKDTPPVSLAALDNNAKGRSYLNNNPKGRSYGDTPTSSGDGSAKGRGYGSTGISEKGRSIAEKDTPTVVENSVKGRSFFDSLGKGRSLADGDKPTVTMATVENADKGRSYIEKLQVATHEPGLLYRQSRLEAVAKRSAGESRIPEVAGQSFRAKKLEDIAKRLSYQPNKAEETASRRLSYQPNKAEETVTKRFSYQPNKSVDALTNRLSFQPNKAESAVAKRLSYQPNTQKGISTSRPRDPDEPARTLEKSASAMLYRPSHIPRGGSATTSPVASPLVARQRTAPNSRSTSPSGPVAGKRFSLGSFVDSRLPVRKRP